MRPARLLACSLLLLAALAGVCPRPAAAEEPPGAEALARARKAPWSEPALKDLMDAYRLHASIGTLVRQLASTAKEEGADANDHILLARVLSAAGDRRRAETALRGAIKAGDKSTKTRLLLATILEETGRLNEAKKALLDLARRTADRHQAADLYRRLGIVESRQGNQAAAKAFWLKIIRLDLGSFAAYRRVAQILVEQGYVHDAIDLYAELAARARDPQTAANAHYQVGRLRDSIGLHAVAALAYRAALARLPAEHWLRTDILRRLLKSEAAAGRTETLKKLQADLAAKPDNKSLRLLLADTIADRGKIADAIKIVRAGLAKAPKDPRMNAKLRGLLLRAKDRAGYLAELRRSIAQGGASDDLYDQTLRALLQDGKDKEAAAIAEKIAAGGLEGLARVAEIYASAGKPETAVAFRKRAAEAEKKGTGHRVRYITALLASKRRRPAIDLAEKMAKAGDFDGEDAANLAELFLENNAAETAVTLLRAAVVARPKDAEIRETLAAALWNAGKRNESLETFLALFRDAEDDERDRLARRASGLVAGLAKEEAVTLVMAHNRKNKPNGLTLLALGRVYAAAKDTPRAVMALKQAIEKDVSLLVAYEELASVYLNAAKPDVSAAVAALEKAARIDRKNRLARYSAIVDILVAAKKPETARTYWRRIEAAMPDDPYLLIRLADRHRKLGNHERFLLYLERASNIPGAPQEIHGRLGKYYRAVEKPALALREYQRVLAGSTDPDDLASATKNIAHVAHQLYRRAVDQAGRRAAKGNDKGARDALRGAVRPLTLMVRYAPGDTNRWTALLRLARVYEQLDAVRAAADAYAETARGGPADQVAVDYYLEAPANRYATAHLRNLLAGRKDLAAYVKKTYGLSFPADKPPNRPRKVSPIVNPEIAWTVSPGGASGPVFLGAAGDGSLPVGSPGLRALRLKDGSEKKLTFRLKPGFQMLRPLAAKKGSLLLQVGSKLREIGSDGRTRWVLAIPRETGTVRDVAARHARLAYAAGLVVVAAGDQVFAFDIAALDVKWRVPLSRAAKPSPVAFATVGVEASYVVTADGLVTALSLADGARLWAVKIPFAASVAIGGKEIHVVCNGSDTIVSLDRKSGKKTATHNLILKPLTLAAAEAGGSLLYFAEPGAKPRVFAYDLKKGKVAWSLPIPPGKRFVALTRPVLSADRILVGTSDGRVIAIRQKR